MNNYKGSLVCIEGIDGAGTTTLADNLKKEYPNAVFTQEPSNQYWGEKIRERLSQDNDPTPADFFGFLADRYQHCENVIKPALKDGKLVISDRYALSTYAYQSKVLDDSFEHMVNPHEYIAEMTHGFTIEPDEYLYLKIDVDTALERIDAEEKYEKRGRLKEAKRNYDYLADEKDNVEVIHAGMHEEKVLNTALTYLQKYE